MLVLSRRVGESICIGDNVTINIVKVSGNRVRVGIEAPRDVEILRGELAHWSREPAESNSMVHTVLEADFCV